MIIKVVINGVTKKVKLDRVSFQDLLKTMSVATQTPKSELIFNAINLKAPMLIWNEETFSTANHWITTYKPAEQLKLQLTHTRGDILSLKPKEVVPSVEQQPGNSGSQTQLHPPAYAATVTLMSKGLFCGAGIGSNTTLLPSVVSVNTPPAGLENLLLSVCSEIDIGAPCTIQSQKTTPEELIQLLQSNMPKFKSFLLGLKYPSLQSDSQSNTNLETAHSLNLVKPESQLREETIPEFDSKELMESFIRSDISDNKDLRPLEDDQDEWITL
jgi:hypothetical protein